MTSPSSIRVHAVAGTVDVAAAAQMACLLEASAPKPGNVSPGRVFRDTRYEDFLASALAVGEPLRRAAQRPLGATILACIEATRTWTSANTNLGIVLLLAPLVKAAAEMKETQRIDADALQEATTQVLTSTTVQDARDVYAAIRLASPGGLGRVDAQDVETTPTVNLRSTMQLAAHRDTIAREYVTSFALSFGTSVPALRRARTDGLDWNEAIVETFLTLLTSTPDTHIARRLGDSAATAVRDDARRVLDAGGVRTAAGRRALSAFDTALRDPLNARNPGTTADLTTAAIFIVLLCGGWRR